MIQWAVLFWIPPLLLYFVNSRTRTRCTRRLENFGERYFNSPYRQIKLCWSHSLHNEQKKSYFLFSNYLGTTLHSYLPVTEIPLCWSSLICFFHSEIWVFFFIRLINVSSFKCKLVTSCIYPEPPEIPLWEPFLFLFQHKNLHPRFIKSSEIRFQLWYVNTKNYLVKKSSHFFWNHAGFNLLKS